jgi:hypothetical protein
MAAAAVVATVAWLPSACTGSRPTAPLPGRPSSAGPTGLHCSDAIGEQTTPDPYVPVLDAVALDTTSTLQAADLEGSGPHRLFAKTPLLVHAGHAATLTLPADWVRRASITWGNNAPTWVTGLVVACPALPSGQDLWHAFPGGFSVDHPACVPLEVRTGTRSTTIHVSVGRPCRR